MAGSASEKASRKPEIISRLAAVKVLEDVCAIPPAREGAGPEAAEEPLELADAKPFEDAGWRFVRKKADPQQPDPFGVVVDRDGKMKILGPAITVRFDDDLPEQKVADILKAENLAVQRRLGFQSNLYTVKAQDALAQARRLNEREDVVYADPVLIEPIGER